MAHTAGAAEPTPPFTTTPRSLHAPRQSTVSPVMMRQHSLTSTSAHTTPSTMTRGVNIAMNHTPRVHNRQHSTASSADRLADRSFDTMSIDTTAYNWQNSSVSNWRHMEAELRQNAEDKAEELRQLVGKRYRVLIDTADHIQYMQQLATNTLNPTINEFHHTYDVFQHAVHDPTLIPKITLKTDPYELCRSFMSAHQHIWNDIDRHQYVHAVELYIQAQRNGYELLRLMKQEPHLFQPPHIVSTNSKNNNSLEYPSLQYTAMILSRYATALEQFPHTIQRIATKQLSSHSTSSSLLDIHSDVLTSLLILATNSDDTMKRTSDPSTSATTVTLRLVEQYLAEQLQQIRHTLWSADKAISILPEKHIANNYADNILSHCISHVAEHIIRTFVHGRQLFGNKPTKHVDRYYKVNVLSRLQHFIDHQHQQRQRQDTSTSTSYRSGEASAAQYKLSDAAIVRLYSKWFQDVTQLLSQDDTTGKSTNVSIQSLISRANSASSLAHVRDRLLGRLCFASPMVNSPTSDTDPSNNVTEDAMKARQSTESRNEYLQFDDAVRVLLNVNIDSKITSNTLWDTILLQPIITRSKELMDERFELFGILPAIDDVIQKLEYKYGRQQRRKPTRVPSLTQASSATHGSGVSDSEGSDDDEDNISVEASAAPSTLSGVHDSDVQHIVAAYNQQIHRVISDIKSILQSPYLCSCSSKLTVSCPIHPQSKQTNSAISSMNQHQFESQTQAHQAVRFSYLEHTYATEFIPHIQRMYTQRMQEMVDTLRQRLNDVEYKLLDLTSTSLSKSGIDDATSVSAASSASLLIEQSVLVGRVCYSLAHTVRQKEVKGMKSQVGVYDTILSSAASNQYIGDSLMHAAKSAFRIWSKHCAAAVAELFTIRLLDKTFHTKALSPSSSSQPSSSANEPQHPSAYVFELLLNVAQELYSAHGTDVHDDVVQWLIQDVSSTLLRVYESNVEKLQDDQQHVVDLVVIFTLLPPADKTSESTPDTLLAKISNKRIQSFHHAQRQHAVLLHTLISKHKLVFGALLGSRTVRELMSTFRPMDPSSATSASASTSASNTIDNRSILPLAPVATRIPTISATLYPTKPGYQHVVSSATAAVHATTTSATPSASATTALAGSPTHRTFTATSNTTAPSSSTPTPASASALWGNTPLSIASAAQSNADGNVNLQSMGLNLINTYSQQLSALDAQAVAAAHAQRATEVGRELLGKGRNLLGQHVKWFGSASSSTSSSSSTT